MIQKFTTMMVVMVLILSMTTYSYAEVPGITDGNSMLAELKGKISNISTKELKKEIANNSDLVLIDIRTKGEIMYLEGSIDAAQNTQISRGWLEFKATKIAPNKDTPIVIYCGGNIRSPLAADTLMEMGYTNVKNYSDGFLGWKKAGLPVKKP